MKTSHIVKALNMSAGEVLTLDKAADRLEFEALPSLEISSSFCDELCVERCGCKSLKCGNHNPVPAIE